MMLTPVEAFDFHLALLLRDRQYSNAHWGGLVKFSRPSGQYILSLNVLGIENVMVERKVSLVGLRPLISRMVLGKVEDMG